jgi:type I restriction enzyme S subunit
MAVKPRYKQTEVGVIPDDWGVDFIENLAYITTGGKNTQDRIHDGQYPFFVRSQTVERIDSYSFDGEAVLTAGDGVGTGKVFHYINGKFDVHQRVYRISDFCDRINGYYFFLYFSTHFYNRIMQMTAKSSVDSVRRDMIARMPIPVPPTEAEQRAIAAALSDVDALLDALERLIAKKRDLKQAAMQQLLTGETRLPGFYGEWEVKRLGEVADVKTGPFGSSLHESDYVEEGTPIITVEHLGEFGVEHFNLPLVSDIDRRRLQAYSLAPGDIVFSRVGSVDRNALIRPPEAGWLFSGRLLRVRPDTDTAYAPFLSFQFHSEPFKASVRTVAVGQTMASLNTHILNGVCVTLPSLPEQTAIADVLSQMDTELSALETRRQKTRAVKQGMMQELLTGRTRLVPTDVADA